MTKIDSGDKAVRPRMSRRAVVFAGAGAVLAGCASAADNPRPFRERIAERRRRAAGETAAPEQTAASDALRGDFVVREELGEFVDEARASRKVVWKAYLPSGAPRAPVVLYSHGGGGTRESGKIYGEHLASHGVAALHLQHQGSDRDAFRSNPQQISAAARDPKLGAPRFQDIGFVVGELRRGGPLSSSLDPDRIGVSGHSFGAITALIAAGQIVQGYGQDLAVPSLKAAFALSPSPPRPSYGDADSAFSNMLMPLFHLTGTEDDAPNGDFKAPARRIPFDRTRNVDQRLLILQGANHFTFGGDPNPQLRGRSFSYPGLARHHDLIRTASLAFWRIAFSGDAAARRFLDDGAFRALLGPGDTLEFKPAA